MKNILGELILELRVKSEHFNEARNVQTFEITVSESADVAAGLDDDHVAGGVGRGAHGGVFTRSQMLGNVAADQIAFACNNNNTLYMKKFIAAL